MVFLSGDLSISLYAGPMTSPQDALAHLRAVLDAGELDDDLLRLGVGALTAFGSAVDPDPPRPPRDLDIGVVGPRRQPVDILGVAALVDHLVGCEVDVVDAGRADPVAAVHAMRGQGLWEMSAGLLAEARIQAELEWMDTRWLRQLDLARLRR